MTAPQTVEGWYVLHDFRKLDRARWQALPTEERRRVLAETARWAERALSVPAEEGSSALYRVAGHKADLLFLHLRAHLEALQELEAALDAAPLAAYCTRPTSFLSVVELSLYGASEEVRRDPLAHPGLRRRLFLQIPARRYVCFYPMNRRRQGEDNWYLLPYDTRRRLLEVHGETGRRYAEWVTQMITGAIGLDDWEWGVTLWADDPLYFKKLVYEMRFDEISARFAEFGPFYVGTRMEPGELVEKLL